MKDFNFLTKQYIVPTYVNRGLVFTRGEGCYLFDASGTQYLDLMSSYGASILGYSHPILNEQIIKQAQQLVNLHGSFVSDVRASASQKLIERCGKNYSHVYWSNSGAEAVEAALKFAAVKTGKKKFISAKNSYHGKTLGALSATGIPKYRVPFEPLLWDFSFHDYGNSESLRSLMSNEVAAVIIEPMQGDGGMTLPPSGYLEKVRAICTEFGALLIIDEIQTGTGRTGTFLLSETIQADILCLGKGLAGGLPVGATIVTPEVLAAIPKGLHTSTFAGSPLVCAGVLAVLEIVTDEFLQKEVAEKGAYFQHQLTTLKNVVQIRGTGLMLGIEVSENRDLILKKLQTEKILAIPAADNIVRFLPPYIITKPELDRTIEILHKILSA